MGELALAYRYAAHPEQRAMGDERRPDGHHAVDNQELFAAQTAAEPRQRRVRKYHQQHRPQRRHWRGLGVEVVGQEELELDEEPGDGERQDQYEGNAYRARPHPGVPIRRVGRPCM